MTDGLIIPPTKHRCVLPEVEVTAVIPFEDGPAETTWMSMPRLGTYWRCECGTCWRVDSPLQYANIVICTNRWVRVPAWRYRRAARRAARSLTA